MKAEEMKVGDKVRIKDSDTCSRVFYFYNEGEMAGFCGQIGTIVDIVQTTMEEYPDGKKYFLDISNISYSYMWNNLCLEKEKIGTLMPTE